MAGSTSVTTIRDTQAMRRAISVVSLILLLAIEPVSAQDLRIHGSNTVGANLAPALVEAWLVSRGYGAIRRTEIAAEEKTIHAQSPAGKRLTIEIHSHGSSTGFRDLASGDADIAMSSRAIRDSEVTQLAGLGLGPMDRADHEIIAGLDGIAVVVHPDNAIDSLSMAQLRDVFSGRIRNWSRLGGPDASIQVYARDDKSGTYDTFRSLVLTDGAILADSARRYESNDLLSDQVSADPNGIGFVGLPSVRDSKAMAVADGGSGAIAATPASVATEDYPLARRLFLYVPDQVGDLGRSFVEFVVGDAGQTIVSRVGFVDQAVRAVATSPRSGWPADYRETVAGARRLSLNFRFRASEASLDSKAMRDLDRLVRYMQRDTAAHELILLGFADRAEISPYLSLVLSTDRADYVADLLIQRGVSPDVVRGLGAAVPVASNDSARGRQKNRRVEIWVRPTQRNGSGAVEVASGK